MSRPINVVAAGVLAMSLLLVGCGTKPAPEASAGAAEEAGHDHDEEKAGEADGHAHEEGEEADTDSTTIKAAMAEQAGIRSAAAQAGTIADEHEVQGLLMPVDGRVAQVMARFPGPIRSLRANVGDRVSAGQTLASIDSN
ncbi:MAG: hypothetical protein ACN6Q8_03105, partial [Stenotrophomonas sp.]